MQSKHVQNRQLNRQLVTHPSISLSDTATGVYKSVTADRALETASVFGQGLALFV